MIEVLNSILLFLKGLSPLTIKEEMSCCLLVGVIYAKITFRSHMDTKFLSGVM